MSKKRKQFANGPKDKFLAGYPQDGYEWPTDNLSQRCKFNFSYFTKDKVAGQSFEEWETSNLLSESLTKLQAYSCNSLEELSRMRIGGASGTVFQKYGNFPSHSKFTQPKHIPAFALWGRIWVRGGIRVAGFTIPDELHNCPQDASFYHFDKNTFYVVFLDNQHEFYPSTN